MSTIVKYGTVKRTKPRIRSMRGFLPNQATFLTQAARVQANVTIKSGQVISKVWNSDDEVYEWVLGCAAGRTAYWAYQDSTDEDVISANSLIGLSSHGDYELQTAYFKAADVFNDDVLLTYDGVTGDVKATTAGSGDPVIAVVTRIRGPKDLGSGSYPEDSSASTQDVIQFQTHTELNAAGA